MFKHYAWHGHPLILGMLKLLHFAIQLSPNLPHLMSILKIPSMFPTIFLSRFFPRIQNMDNPFFILHTQPSTLWKESIMLALSYHYYK